MSLRDEKNAEIAVFHFGDVGWDQFTIPVADFTLTAPPLNPTGTRCGYDSISGDAGCYRNAVPSTDCSSGWEVPDDCERQGFTYYKDFLADFGSDGILPSYCGCVGKCICKKSGTMRDDWYCGDHDEGGAECCLNKGEVCGHRGRTSDGLLDTSTEDSGCYAKSTRQEVADNECPRLTPDGTRFKSNDCCSGGCIVREYRLQSRLSTNVVEFIPIRYKSNFRCDFLPEGGLCGQDGIAWSDQWSGKYTIIPGCNPETDGTWTGERFEITYTNPEAKCVDWYWPGVCTKWESSTYTHTWYADDIWRARAPHCEVYALREPVIFFLPGLIPSWTGASKMYGSGRMNWYCKKEGCWESGKICGRDGGWGISDLGCFKDSVSYGGKRYWAGCCSGEIEKTTLSVVSYSPWYQCK